MPHERGPGFDPTGEKPQKHDAQENRLPPDILEQKREQFALLKDEIKNYHEAGLNEMADYVLRSGLVKKVLGHSIRDGLEIAYYCGADGGYIRRSLEDYDTDRFFLKKIDFYRDIYRLSRDKNAWVIRAEIQPMLDAFDRSQKRITAGTRPKREKTNDMAPDFRKISEQIDDYYKDFLQTRNIDAKKSYYEKELPFALSHLDRFALGILRDYNLAAQGAIERSQVIEMIYQAIQPKTKASPEYMEQVVIDYVKKNSRPQPSRYLADEAGQISALLERTKGSRFFPRLAPEIYARALFIDQDDYYDYFRENLKRARYRLPKEIFTLRVKTAIDEIKRSMDGIGEKNDKAGTDISETSHFWFEHKLWNMLEYPELSSPDIPKTPMTDQYTSAIRGLLKDMLEELDDPRPTEKHLSFFRRQFKENPIQMMETVSAKSDTKEDRDALFEFLFPGLKKKMRDEKEMTTLQAFWSFGKSKKGAKQSPQPTPLTPEDYFSTRSETKFLDGDPIEQSGAPLLYITPTHEFIPTAILGPYNRERNTFSEANFPQFVDVSGERKTVEIMIPLSKSRANHENKQVPQHITIPKLLGSRVSRVETLSGEPGGAIRKLNEINLPETDTATNVVLDLPAQGDFLRYRVERSAAPEARGLPEALDTKAYNRAMQGFERTHGSTYTEQIMHLPAEFKLFVKSIEHLNPLEKCAVIEQKVREIGFYDKKNREVMEKKSQAAPEERLRVMELRMQELKKRAADEAGGEIDNRKIYAGVCADFNLLTLALLREAKISSGLMTGFLPKPKAWTVSEQEAHGVAYVIWPVEAEAGWSKTQSYRIIPVDGTPASSVKKPESHEDDEVHEALPSMYEKIDENARARDREQVGREQDMHSSERELKPEPVLTTENEEVIATILNALQYSPLNVFKISAGSGEAGAGESGVGESRENVKQLDVLVRNLAQEIARVRASAHAHVDSVRKPEYTSARNQIVERLRDFVSKTASVRGLTVLQKVTRLLQSNLSENERQIIERFLQG